MKTKSMNTNEYNKARALALNTEILNSGSILFPPYPLRQNRQINKYV